MKTIAALVLLGSMTVAAAGEEIPPGTRVRVNGRGSMGTITGSLVGIDGRRVTVRDAHGERSLALRDITGIDVSRKPGRRGKYALVGMAVGAAAGFVLGAATNPDGCKPSPESYCLFGPGPFFSDNESGAMVGVPLGLVGAAIGALAGGERWKPADDPRLGVALAVRPGRMAAALSVRFQ